ncbi:MULTISPECIES: YdbL family protein [Sphingomonadales]|uniref:DUF1318 domain-containing protein n=2 Tax=Edaphosphingomonas TaxID=3423724 RepID=A0A2T4I7V6_9SPHN|nr:MULTISPECIES: YdbL family protein [Sphingomonas]AGH48947.1 hypothetical protein G432_06100 [Sphingomonas sp. MM-1]MDX3884519.1 YdbL family protein [Sphingomonas sp.]OHT21363.1 hypothetical protein BHE75_03370 [Sphingomonas haloaromaticamans]PTD27336.1 DUF1318 domain-containing protein [Sphingomonas fennica]
MTRKTKLSFIAMAAAAALGMAGYAWAQAGDAALTAAIAAGQVGEQSDGYLGVAKPVGADVRAAVESLNIKRRAAYTDQAAKHGVALREWAATVGCQTLRGRVKPGQAYLLPDGVWRVKDSSPIALPANCG